MKFTIICALFVLFHSVSYGQKSQNLTRGLALQGYDPVTYFQSNIKKGSESITTLFEGATYRFSSETNKNLFLKQPTKYLPQYGGWCAYAIGKTGEKVTVNPLTYKIIDEKLYLFYNAKGNNTLTLWNSNETTLLNQANSNWNKLKK